MNLHSYYGDSFTFLYVSDVRTSQETHASTVCYVYSFSFIKLLNSKFSSPVNQKSCWLETLSLL
jgi:hypothetical protein